MTEHTFLPPLAKKPDYMENVKEVDDMDDVEICPGVYASSNIVNKTANILQQELQAAEPAVPKVRQILKQVTHDCYKPYVEMVQVARVFEALVYGDITADDLEPNNKRLQALCDKLLHDDFEALRLLYVAAMEYGYKLAQEQQEKKAVE